MGSVNPQITINLARAIQLDGASVAVIDCDPQGTTTDWGALNSVKVNFSQYTTNHVEIYQRDWLNLKIMIVFLNWDGGTAPRRIISCNYNRLVTLFLTPLTPSPK